MKGFSEAVEKLVHYPESIFPLLPMMAFATITVEPVPNIGYTPFDLRNEEMNLAVHYQKEYHKKRIEREGRG